MTNAVELKTHIRQWRTFAVSAALTAVLTIALVFALPPSSAFAQHVMPADASQSDVELESSPENDEVTVSPPQDLMLRFSTYVKLVKLTMKGPDEKLVNIGFRYDPNLSRVFLWALPELPAADYYTVEWSAVDTANLIARGTFSFSFGPNAKPASELIPEEEILEHVTVPDFRLLDQ